MGKRNRKMGLGCMVAGMLLWLAFAVEGEASETELEIPSVSVTLPVAAETGDSLFDFILDPYGLVSRTEAMRYGGGSVEEGATLLFFSREGTYDFSKDSDRVTVRSQTPVEVTVSASVNGLGELAVVEDRDFSESDVCGLYLALVDDQGNELPLSADGEVSVSRFMEAGSCSFGLTGACNPDADWQDLSVHPGVTVTWRVEPVMTEEEEEPETNEPGGAMPETVGNAAQEPSEEEGGSKDEEPEEKSGEAPDQEKDGGGEKTTVPGDGETEEIPKMNEPGENVTGTTGNVTQEPSEEEAGSKDSPLSRADL